MSSHLNTAHHVVILGGGITGLSAAFHLARKHPTLRITLIEKSNRFGGWIRSDRVEVYDKNGNRGSVLLESGPRSIRPNSKSILELVRSPSPLSDRSILSFLLLDTSPRFAFQSPLHATRLTRRPEQVLAHPSFTRIATSALQSLLDPHASPRPSRPQSRTHRTLRKPQSQTITRITTTTSWERRRRRIGRLVLLSAFWPRVRANVGQRARTWHICSRFKAVERTRGVSDATRERGSWKRFCRLGRDWASCVVR
jgi:hypothetical protein